MILSAVADTVDLQAGTCTSSDCPNPAFDFESPDMQLCRSRPTWEIPTGEDHNWDPSITNSTLRERCQSLFGYYPNPEELIEGNYAELSSTYDFATQSDDGDDSDDEKYYEDYDALDAIHRPLIQRLGACIKEQTADNIGSQESSSMVAPAIVKLHRRESDGIIIMAEVENVLNGFEADSVAALARCLRENLPDVFEVRHFEESGGNDCTYMAGFLQILVPGVAAQLRRVLHSVWKEAKWGDDTMPFVPIDLAEGGNRDTTTSEYSNQWWPNPLEHSRIRTTEYLTYDTWGSLGTHEDAGSDYTVVVSLSNPSDYDGGAFSILPDFNAQNEPDESTKISIKPSKLSAIVFLSEINHRVEKILSPGRITFANEFWRYRDSPTMTLRPTPKRIVFGDPTDFFNLGEEHEDGDHDSDSEDGEHDEGNDPDDDDDDDDDNDNDDDDDIYDGMRRRRHMLNQGN